MNGIKVLVHSKHGHTLKVGEAIAAALHVNLDTIPVTEEISEPLIFLGSGIYAGKVDTSVIELIEKLDPAVVKNVALFSTSMRGEDQLAPLRDALKKRGINIVPQALTFKGKFLFFNIGHPTKEDLVEAALWGNKIAQSLGLTEAQDGPTW